MSPNATFPRVGIVVLNWNGYRVTRRCLESLRGLDYPSVTFYVLDNGSTDDSWRRLVPEFTDPRAVFIQNGANLGFAAGCNPGIRRALSDGCDYVLLLNNDTIAPDPAFLRTMVELGESDRCVGVVGGRILRYPDTATIWCTGGAIGWFGERYIGMGEPDRGQYAEIAERRFISGALMLVKRAVLEQVGLLPEEYFFGHEDWEYGVRVRRAGWRLLYQPRAVIWHEVGGSHAAVDPAWVYNDILAKILFKKRTMSPLAYGMWRAAYTLYLGWLFPLRRRYQAHVLLGGIAPERLRTVMLDALKDSRGLSRVSADAVARYRERIARSER